MIYAEALISDRVLIAKGECGGYPNNTYGSEDDFRHSDPTLALLRANKTINSEAIPVFFAVNTFKLSPVPGLGRHSVFTNYASLFRNVVVELFNHYCVKYREGEILDTGTSEDLIQIWRDQIRLLAAMTNLRFLELNIHSMLVEALTGNATLKELFGGLKPQLLASVPSGVRQKKGVRGCGVWLTMSMFDSYSIHMRDIGITWLEVEMDGICSEDMHRVGEGWRELGINFQPERCQRCFHHLESSDSANSSPCYYG